LLKKITALLSLVLMFAFTSSAVAQDVPAMDPSEVDGLESGYARMYIADIDALMATPGALESIDAIPLSGMAAVFTFEDEGAAEDAMGDFADEFANAFLEGAEVEAEETEIDDLGNQAVQYSGTSDVDETTTADTTMIIVQEGEFIYISFILGGEDVDGLTRGLVEHMMDGEISDEEVVVVQDGTSTGGAFEIMPNAENPEDAAGMVPFMDLDFLEGSME
jgi:hypothetical protein